MGGFRAMIFEPDDHGGQRQDKETTVSDAADG